MKILTYFKVSRGSSETDAFFTDEEIAITYGGSQDNVQTIHVFESIEDKKKFDAISKLTREEIDLLGLSEMKPQEDEKFLTIKRRLLQPLEDTDLSVRAFNAFKPSCKNLKDIVLIHQRTDGYSVPKMKSDLLKFKFVGKTTLTEIENRLAEVGGSLDMDMTPYK